MAGRPPSPGQSAAQRAHAEAERERYRSLSPERRRELIQTRDREAQQEADRRRNERNPERFHQYRAANANKYPEKRKARAVVQLALSTGKLTKPAACQRCGAKTALEAHHPDHSKPMAVKWYCATCHGKTQQAGSVEQHPHGQKGPVA